SSSRRTSTPPSRSRWKATRSTAQPIVSRSRSSWSRARAARESVSASAFQITWPGCGSFHDDRLDEPVLALQEARDRVQRAAVRAGLQADAIRQDVAHGRIAHEHLPERPQSWVGTEEPLAARRVPLPPEHETDGSGRTRRCGHRTARPARAVAAAYTASVRSIISR